MDNAPHTKPHEALNRTPAHLLLVSLLVLAAYSNTFGSPFFFDDLGFVINQRLRDLGNVPSMFTDPWGPLASRPLMNATFALNFFLGRFDVWGYHALNLALHLANSVLFYWLITLTAGLRGVDRNTAAQTALAATLLFALHPVQTETVTYVVTRSMLLATGFYLLGMVLFARAVTAKGSTTLYAAGLLLVSLLGMASREDFVTFPVMLMAYDLFFVSKFRARDFMRNMKLHLPVLLSLIYLAFLVSRNSYGESAGFDVKGITAPEYLMTQFNAHWTYLRLLALPVGQNLDYDYPVARTLLELPTFFSFLGYAGLWAAGLLLARKRPVIAFSVLWFMVTLVPTSSIMPIKDLLFEHRLYLPSAGVFAGVAAATVHLTRSKGAQKAFVLALLGTALVLGAATYARNAVWSDGISLWSDVVKKSPLKARGYGNLALNYFVKGDTEKAIEMCKTALRLEPLSPDRHYNLASIYLSIKDYQQARTLFEAALDIDPAHIKTLHSLGRTYMGLGLPDEAVRTFQELARLRPNLSAARNNLGTAYLRAGRPEDALREYLRAHELEPDWVSHYALSEAYRALGLEEKARAHGKKAQDLRKALKGAVR